MSMSDDVGNMVAGGFAAGVAVGLRNQRDREVSEWAENALEWQQYAKKLESRVLDRDIELSRKDVDIARKNSEIARLQHNSLAHDVDRAILLELYNGLIKDINSDHASSKYRSLRREIRDEIVSRHRAAFNASGTLTFG